jgi:hypothetical protein
LIWLSGLITRAELEANPLARAIRFHDLVHQRMHSNRVRERARKRRTGRDVTRMG